MTRFSKLIAIATASLFMVSCATLLHPERKGNRGGSLDTVPLVVDILLFLPGLIPGVIAIAVDFSTGAIYTGGGKAEAPKRSERAVARTMQIRAVDDDGVVVRQQTVDVQSSGSAGAIAFADLSEAIEGGQVHLEVATPGGAFVPLGGV